MAAMDLGLADHVYLVTGGTRGLGRATVQCLLDEGASIVVSGRDATSVEQAASELGAPARVAGVAADNADPATGERLVAAAQQRFGRCDGALISVGGPPAGPALAATDDQWRESFESIFLGAVRIARATIPVLPEGGALAFVLSSSTRSPIPGLAISNGLRPGLGMLAKTMADELGPRGIRVLGLLPGRLATDRTLSLDKDEAARRNNEAAIPLRRYGEPAEFGRVAAFLLSPAASYLTGCMIPVEGGALRTL
jgi:3-oxoacyl-[acyl-carrier protein] reductase